MEHQNLQVPEVREMLEGLMAEYGMSAQALGKLLGIPPEAVSGFAAWEDRLPPLQRSLIANTVATLYCMPRIPADERTRAVVDVLEQVHGISRESIARLAGAEPAQLEGLMGGAALPGEVKYRLASTIMMLHFLYKPQQI